MFARSSASWTLITIASFLTAVGSAPAMRASAGPVQTEVQDLGAGMWNIATRIDELDIPGLPSGIVRKIASDPANAKPRTVCMASPPPVAAFHTLNGACSYESWQARNGTVQAVLVCSPPDGEPGAARVEVNGTYTGSTFEVVSETIARDKSGETQLQMLSTISGRLISAAPECAKS